VTRAPLKRRGRATCDACGRVMAEWNGKVVPSFKLVPDSARIEGSDGNADQPGVAAIAEVVVRQFAGGSPKGRTPTVSRRRAPR